jgi:hypothetical protein
VYWVFLEYFIQWFVPNPVQSPTIVVISISSCLS